MCSFGLIICNPTTFWHIFSLLDHKNIKYPLCLYHMNVEQAKLALQLFVTSTVGFSSHLCERTRKRYLYTPGRAQSAVRSSWHPGLASARREIPLWRGVLSSSPWQTRWSGKPLRWCLLDTGTDHLEENKNNVKGEHSEENPARKWLKTK